MENNQLKALKVSIHLNAYHGNGMTHFDFALRSIKLVKIHISTVNRYYRARIRKHTDTDDHEARV